MERSESLRTLLEFALDVTWKAGQATLAHFQTGVQAETKADASPVTVADRTAERIVREAIAKAFPGDGILGEEMGETGKGATRRWVVDPIDGTRSFVHGVPLYGVLLALEEAGSPQLGVLHFPALGETVYAARGEGCWWNGRRAEVSPTDRLEDALVLTSGLEYVHASGREADWNRVAQRVRAARTWGDCYGYALVATGRADAMLDPVVSVWDTAALVPVIEEAGGVFTDWQGRPGHTAGSAVATNASLADVLRRTLRGGDASDARLEPAGATPAGGGAGRGSNRGPATAEDAP